MIWNEYEAYVVQVKQIGTSACGPTAVLNVLVSGILHKLYKCFSNKWHITAQHKFDWYQE